MVNKEQSSVYETWYDLPRRSIIGYMGGGYEGCVFEWNYVLIDADGGFHDLYSSGALAVKDSLELAEREYIPWMMKMQAYRKEREQGVSKLECKFGMMPDEVVIYSVIDSKDLAKFAENEGAKSVLRCIDPLSSLGVYVQLPCSACGNDFTPPSSNTVSVENGEFVCDDCHESNCCSNCDEYLDNDPFNFPIDGSKFEPGTGFCRFCVESRDRKRNGLKGA